MALSFCSCRRRMTSSNTNLNAVDIEADDGQSEPALTEAHVRDIFSHWEAGA